VEMKKKREGIWFVLSGFLFFTVTLIAVACARTAEVSSIAAPWWTSTELLKVIFQFGGLPAVILFFGYLYLRSVQKQSAQQIEAMQKQSAQQIETMQEQIASMQEQVARQQSITIAALNNNTEALTKLGTAMMMGCPLIRSQFLPGGSFDGAKEKDKTPVG